MDMVERVARAVFFRGDEVDETAWNHMQPHLREKAVEEAKAAIRAMLEGLEPDAYVKWDKDNDEISTPLYDLSAIKEAVK